MARVTVKAMVVCLRKQDHHTNKPGNEVYRMFLPDERYCIDFADDFNSEGWQQFDTDQDAHYFGVWVNPVQFLTLTYCEGDWTLVVCEDADHYNAEIQDACKFYDDGYICKAIDTDTGSMTTYVQDRKQFFVKGGAK